MLFIFIFSGYHADVTCLYRGHSIAPFAFRTHSHARGKFIPYRTKTCSNLTESNL